MNEKTEATTTAEAPQSDAERVEVGTVVTDTADAGTDDVEALKAALAAKEAEFNAFQREVAVVTDRYAKAHNLCTVVDSALGELGLQRPRDTCRVTATLSVSFDMVVEPGRVDRRPNDSAVWTAVHAVAYAMRGGNIESAQRRNDEGTGYSNTEITVAEYEIALSDSGSSHLRPEGRIMTCSSCGAAITEGNPRRNDDRCCRSCY